jgi:hypothetical protein
MEIFAMTPKSGGETPYLPTARSNVEPTQSSPNPILSDGIVSGAFLGQAASQALAAAFNQDDFTLDGTDTADNQLAASNSDHA